MHAMGLADDVAHLQAMLGEEVKRAAATAAEAAAAAAVEAAAVTAADAARHQQQDDTHNALDGRCVWLRKTGNKKKEGGSVTHTNAHAKARTHAPYPYSPPDTPQPPAPLAALDTCLCMMLPKHIV